MKMTGGMRGWKLVGNALIGGQFIGTLNDEDMIFQRNGAEVMRLLDNGLIVGGSTLITGVAEARMELQPAASGNACYREAFSPSLAPVAYSTRIYRVPTAGAVVGTANFATLDDTNQLVTLTCDVKQVAGTVGANGDGAAFVRRVHVRNIGGVVTLFNDVLVYNYEVDAGITFTLSAAGANLVVSCQGVANRTLRWGIRLEALSL